MDETVAWLRDRPYYEGQILHHRVLPGREDSSRPVDLDTRLHSVLADQGIEELYDH